MDAPDQDSVKLELIMNAPADAVWNAWTDPDKVLNWFGSDPKGKGVRARLDVRVDGAYQITFKDSDETTHTCSGAYKEVVKNQKLSFTWTWASEPGVETFVTVELSPEDSQTRMKFTHARLGTASKHNYEAGWQTTFEKLSRILH